MGRLALRPGLRAYAHAPAGAAEAELWTPEEITTTAWFDAMDTDTIDDSGAPDYLVSQWDDKSGNAKHAVQATGANQPALNATGFGAGLPTLTFDGVGYPDFDQLVTPGDTFASSAEVGIFLVFKSLDTAWLQDIIAFAGIGSANRGIGFQFNPHTAANTIESFVWGTSYFTVTHTLGTADIAGWTRPSVGSAYTSLHLNGTTTVDTTLKSLTLDYPGSYNHLYLGGYSIWGANAEIAEVVALSTEPSTADRQSLEGYLAWKWDGYSAGTLVGKLPVDHPYKSAAPTL